MDVRRVSVTEGYTHWAKEYDGYDNALIAVEEDHVHALLGDVRGKRVLDAACGTGRHAAWLASQGADVVGVDENEAMLAIARAKCPGVQFHRGPIVPLELAGTFDVVLNALAAEHFADLDALLASLAHPLAPGGVLVLSVWHPFMVLKGVLTHFASDAGVEYELPTHAHLPSAYFRAFVSLGLVVDAMIEPIADDALVAKMPRMKKHAGMPLALIWRARRP